MSNLENVSTTSATTSILAILAKRLHAAQKRVWALEEACKVAREVIREDHPAPKPGTLAWKAIQGLKAAPGPLHTKEVALRTGIPERLMYATLDRLRKGRAVRRVAPSTWLAA